MVKSKINVWLPIALAAALPGASFFASQSNAPNQDDNFLMVWLVASVFIYVFWHTLWMLWDFRRRYKQRSYLVVLSFLFVLLIGWIVGVGVTNPADTIGVLSLRVTLAAIMLTSIQFALRNQGKVGELKLKTERLQTENYRAQLDTIRAKIDPHFLFNSLNTLRAMIRQAHPNSEQFVISLSDFYRRSLHQNKDVTATLADELTLLNAYLFVMQSRNQQAIVVNIDVDEQDKNKKLPSMALQQVVENCFKHNVMTSSQPLNIDIKSATDGYIEVRNNLRPPPIKPDTSGYGLDLLKERYALMNVAEGVLTPPSTSHFIVRLKLT
ncbi:MAG: histidine kinase [Bacteroidota bacterium]